MASQSRKARGMRSQLVVARWFQRNGFPWAESTGAGRSGSDITGMPGLAPEVKARSDLQPLAWLKQAEMNAGLPFVVFRPNGLGEERVGQWGVMARLEVFTQLLRDAGYGDSGMSNSIPEDVYDFFPSEKSSPSPVAEGVEDGVGQQEQQEANPSTDENDPQPATEGELGLRHAKKAT